MLPKVEDGERILVCSCGYKKGGSLSLKEEKKEKEKELPVIEKEESVNVIIEAECPKCGNNRAEYWEVQTRSSDEPPTRFHKCTKCGHTWREYT